MTTTLATLSSIAVLAGASLALDGRMVSWRLLAQSHLVVVGTLHVPTALISDSEGKHPGYVDIEIEPHIVYKGSADDQLVVRYYPNNDGQGPDHNSLRRLNGGKVIACLIQVDDPDAAGLYFAGNTPNALLEYTLELARTVSEELQSQEHILQKAPSAIVKSTATLDEEVQQLIESMLNPETAQSAYEALEQLGNVAVPAIILRMDDRRELAVQYIALENRSPDAFEGIRHYEPEVVIDVLAAILNQVTGESFGAIYNGASDRERKQTLAGWRIYLARRSRSGGT
jgi:hypothetical protein